MYDVENILDDLIQEGIAARVHYQTWWALRNLALPDYYDTMNDYRHVDFFHASNSGHYKLIFITLAKIFDPDSKAAGLRSLRIALEATGRNDLRDHIQKACAPMTDTVKKVMRVRNQTIAHNQKDLSREKAYKLAGITPNQMRDLINDICDLINYIARDLGRTNTIFDSDRAEEATLRMLERLRDGKK